MSRKPLKWHHRNATDNPLFLDALTKVRDMGVQEGRCCHHVRTMPLSIGQCQPSALQPRSKHGTFFMFGAFNRMSGHQLDLSFVHIGLRAGFACAVTAVVVVASFFFIRFLAGVH